MPIGPSPILRANLDAIRDALTLLNAKNFVPTGSNLDQQIVAVRASATTADTAVESLSTKLNESSTFTREDEDAIATALVALPTVLPGAVSGILLAIDGFDSGDVLSGVQGIMDSLAALAPAIAGAIGAGVGSLVPVLGTAIGAQIGMLIGMAVGAIFSMISDILAYFAPRTETVAETISRMLGDQKADQVYAGIRRVQRSFLLYATSLGDACKQITAESVVGTDNKPDPKTDKFQPAVYARIIDQMNFVEGNTMTSYWDVVDWLAQPGNQTHALWPLILDATCSAYTVLLTAVMRLQLIVTSRNILARYQDAIEKNDTVKQHDLRDLWNAATAKIRVYAVANRLNLQELRALRPAVQNLGTLWRFTPALEAGLVDPSVSAKTFSGNSVLLSITVCSQDQALSNPPYHQYAMDGANRLYYWRVLAGTTNGKLDFQTDGPGTTPHFTIQDVFAIPGVDLKKQNHALVYTVSGNRIEGRFFDQNGVQFEANFLNFILVENSHLDALTSVRAVHNPIRTPTTTPTAHSGR